MGREALNQELLDLERQNIGIRKNVDLQQCQKFKIMRT